MDAMANERRGAASSVLQQVLNRKDQAGQGLLTNDKHLFNIKIKILMSDDTAKPHCSFPVDMGITILQEARIQTLQTLQRFTGCEELHTDHIQSIFTFLLIQ